jgi:hypothetical protein
MLIFDPISDKNVEAGIADTHIRLRKGVPKAKGAGNEVGKEVAADRQKSSVCMSRDHSRK